jgi:pimeloyl-ACP methyl ester carboxylesterase
MSKRFFSVALVLAFGTCLGQDIQYGSGNGKYVMAGKTRIYYEEYGKGAPLLLLHGGFGSIHDFQKVIPELAKNFRIIAVDSPGHGKSQQADSLSYQLMASLFSKVIDELKLDSAYVLGWSDGGNSGLILAADRPDKIKRLAVSGANATTDGIAPAVLTQAKTLTPEYVSSNMKEWLENYKTLSPGRDDWPKFVNDSRKMWLTRIAVPDVKLRQIRAKTLIIIGDRDIVKPEHAIEMRNAIKGSQLAILPGTSHSTFSAKPDLINKIVIEFLTRK